MQRMSFDIPDKLRKIIDPVQNQVVEWMLQELGLKDIHGDNVIIRSSQTNAGKSKEVGIDNVAALKTNKFIVTVTPKLNPYETMTPGGKGEDDHGFGIPNNVIAQHRPFYEDHELNTAIVEIGSKATIEFNCRSWINDAEVAHSLVQRLNTLSVNTNKYFPIQLNYSYKLPNEVLCLLYALHKMKPERDFKKAVTTSSKGVIHTVVNPNKEGSGEVRVNKTHANIMGRFTSTIETPEADGGEQTTDWYAIDFTFAIQLSVPSKLFVEYPVSVGDTFVADEFCAKSIKPITLPTGHVNDMDFQTEVQEILSTTPLPFHCPTYDIWDVPSHSALYMLQYNTVLTVAFTNDDESGTTISLETVWDTELGLKFKESTLERFRELGDKLLLFDDNDYVLTVYGNDTQLDPKHIHFDAETLTVHIDHLESDRHEHHLVISHKENTNGPFFKHWISDFDIICRKEDV